MLFDCGMLLEIAPEGEAHWLSITCHSSFTQMGLAHKPTPSALFLQTSFMMPGTKYAGYEGVQNDRW